MNFTTENTEGLEVFVSLSCSITDESFPVSQNIIRWRSLFHLLIIEPQDDNTTMVQTFTQFDPWIPFLIDGNLNRIIESRALKLYQELTKFIDDQLEQRSSEF